MGKLVLSIRIPNGGHIYSSCLLIHNSIAMVRSGPSVYCTFLRRKTAGFSVMVLALSWMYDIA